MSTVKEDKKSKIIKEFEKIHRCKVTQYSEIGPSLVVTGEDIDNSNRKCSAIYDTKKKDWVNFQKK